MFQAQKRGKMWRPGEHRRFRGCQSLVWLKHGLEGSWQNPEGLSKGRGLDPEGHGEPVKVLSRRDGEAKGTF